MRPKLKNNLLAGLILSACLGTEALADTPLEFMVQAQTESGAIDGDADDPAIWVHPTDPSKSLVLGTDKKKGLYVFDLSGKEVALFEDGRLNNVDLRPFTLNGESVWLASAAEREAEQIVFWIIRADGTITRAAPFAFDGVPADLAGQVKDIYGSAMMRNPETGQVWALVNYKSGDIIQWEVIDQDGQIALHFARHLKLASQPEGMVSDDRAGFLYVGEEDVAIWRFPGFPGAGDTPVQIAAVPSACFPRDDIEGLSIYDGPDAHWLVASSQGIHRVALFDLAQEGAPCIGLAGVEAGAVDGVTETDGLDITAAPLGAAYPKGMLVMMDDQNEMFTTNFKFISAADLLAPLAK